MKSIAEMFEGPAHNLVWKNRFNEIIDEVYNKYDELFDSYHPPFSAPYPKRLTKEELVEEIKNGGSVLKEFQLDVKITERELSDKDRIELMGGKIQEKYSALIEMSLRICDEREIPTKLITVTYKDKTAESYE